MNRTNFHIDLEVIGVHVYHKGNFLGALIYDVARQPFTSSTLTSFASGYLYSMIPYMVFSCSKTHI